MSIRPIDMQVLLPKSLNVSSQSQNLVNRGETILQQSFNESKKINEKNQKKVKNIDKKEGALVKENKNNFLNSSETKSKNLTKNNKYEKSTGNLIDIKV